jgi:hypothetical protein
MELLHHGYDQDGAAKQVKCRFAQVQTIHDINTVVDNYDGVLALPFGQESPLRTQGTVILKAFLDENTTKCEATQKTDQHFYTKLLWCLQNAINHYLRSCYNSTSSDRISLAGLAVLNSTLERFSPVHEALTTILPTDLLIAKKQTRDHHTQEPLPQERNESPPSNTGNNREDKKSKRTPKSRAVDNNPKVDSNIQRAAKQNFGAFMKQAGTVPRLNDKQICIKWHCGGCCEEQCDRRESHTALEHDTLQQFQKWAKPIVDSMPGL